MVQRDVVPVRTGVTYTEPAREPAGVAPMGDLLWILVSAALVSNFTLVLFLELCAFLGVTNKIVALRLGLANLVVLIITAASVSFLNAFVLATAPYLRLIAFIVVIASMVQIVEMAIKKLQPDALRERRHLPAAHHHELCDPRAGDVPDESKLHVRAGPGVRRGGGARTDARAGADGERPATRFANVPAIAKGTALTSSSPAASRWPSWASPAWGRRLMSLLQIVASGLVFSALFILFAVLRPANKECSGDCGACVTGSCPSEGGKS